MSVPPSRQAGAKWVVLLVLLLVSIRVNAAGLPAKYKDAQQNETTLVPPRRRRVDQGAGGGRGVQGGELAAGGGRLPARRRADRRRPRGDRRGSHSFNPRPPRATEPLPEPILSRGRHDRAMTAAITGDGESDTFHDPVEQSATRPPATPRRTAGQGHRPGRLRADAIKVFENINGTLLLAAALLVLVLLIVIYRSPIFWLIPLFSVHLRRVHGHTGSATLTELGVTVNGQSSRSCPCSCSAPAPTTRCCSSRATARSCAITRTSTTRWRWRCAPPARRSSPPG